MKKFIRDKLFSRQFLKSEFSNQTVAIHDIVGYELFKRELIEKNSTSKAPGTTNERYSDHDVIVSLTTYGHRLFDVFLSIESIMQGTIKPNRILLFLSEGQDRPLPITLQRQVSRGLEVHYTKDLKSYKKIIPALQAFPDAAIITIDDDLLYRSDLVENLVYTHLANPSAICANRIHRVSLDGSGRPMTYSCWDHCYPHDDISTLNFATTGAGTLFPPSCFKESFFDEKLFMSLCPNADDVWVFCMALYQNIRVIKSLTAAKNGMDYLESNAPLEKGLYTTNLYGQLSNDKQLASVWDYLNLGNILEHE